MTAVTEPGGDLWEGRDIPDGFEVPPDISSLNGHKAFTRCDLAALVREGLKPPTLMCQELLYAEGLHSLAGPPDCGKSTFICWAALQVIRDGGEFMLMDEESGPGVYAEKAVSLGATLEELEHLHYYPFPGKTWDADDVGALVNLVAAEQPRVVAWDSSAAFLARAGLVEDNAGDVTRFWSTVLMPCARDHHAAVLIADHDAKNTTSRYARGSGAKLAATDVAYKLDAVTPFSKVSAGTLKLAIAKDRRGWLHRHHSIDVTPGETLEFVIRSVEHALALDAPPLQQALLAELSASPATVDRLRDMVARRTGQQRPARESVSRALNELLDKRLADKIDMGPGAASYWSKA